MTVTERRGNAAPEIVEATADRTSGPAPHEVWFQAVAGDPDGDQLDYRWEFGDGAARRSAPRRSTPTASRARTRRR